MTTKNHTYIFTGWKKSRYELKEIKMSCSQFVPETLVPDNDIQGHWSWGEMVCWYHVLSMVLACPACVEEAWMKTVLVPCREGRTRKMG